jgi:hypothetical protein
MAENKRMSGTQGWDLPKGPVGIFLHHCLDLPSLPLRFDLFPPTLSFRFDLGSRHYPKSSLLYVVS